MKKIKTLFYIYILLCTIFSTYKLFYWIKNIDINIFNVDIFNDIDNEKSNINIKFIKLNFVRNSKTIPIDNDMIMSQNEFIDKKIKYNKILNQYFRKGHLLSIKEIILSNSQAFEYNDGTGDVCKGITKTIDDSLSYILIACDNSEFEQKYTLIHETLHAMHHNYMDLFDKKYKYKWIKEKDFVSDYAKTDIYEDFAETGTHYLLNININNNHKNNNDKLKLFKQFFNEIHPKLF